MIGIEAGWVFSCSGRQPWVIYHVQRTDAAATHAANVGTLFILFVGLYIFLLISTAFVMWFYFQRRPVEKEFQGG